VGLYGNKFGWRRRGLFGFLALRPPLTEHSEREGELLRRYANGARCAVELGVAEGASAWELRRAIDDGGTLYLVDPHRGRLGLSFAGRVARRLVGRVRRGHVVWLRQLSHQAADDWREPIDFLFIDADHTYEGVSRDWRAWASHVVAGGHVALHDARVVQGWTTPDTGPVRLSAELRADPGWEEVDAADTTVVLRRRPTLRVRPV
jgi:predicted O-methyltransferase YrrM